MEDISSVTYSRYDLIKKSADLDVRVVELFGSIEKIKVNWMLGKVKYQPCIVTWP